MVLISAILAPYSIMPRYPGFFYSAQFLIQFIYWLSITFFVVIYYKRINLYQISLWAFYAVICASFGYYVLPFSINIEVLSLSTDITRNAFVFDLICGVPLCFFFMKSYFSKLWNNIILLFLLFVFLFTNGRSAAIIGILEFVLIIYILNSQYRGLVRFSFLSFIFIFIFIQTDYAQIYLDGVANNFENVNPRFANLIRGEDEGDLEEDKSWLHRKLMVDKGLEIVNSYPFFGVGIGNFSYYDSRLKSYMTYSRLGAESIGYYNSRSAHNSYVQIMSEIGYMGLSVVILILVIPIYKLLKVFFTLQIDIEHLCLISILGMSMHFYAISAIYGALPWLVIGLAWGSLQNVVKKSIS